MSLQDALPISIWMLAERFFFNDTATTEIYTLSLHDALPICAESAPRRARERRHVERRARVGVSPASRPRGGPRSARGRAGALAPPDARAAPRGAWALVQRDPARGPRGGWGPFRGGGAPRRARWPRG